jgi:tetratricopeptide (TPR) repeat protein
MPAVQRPPRRWYRFPRFYLCVAACGLLVGGAAYLHFRRGGPEPPEPDMKGIDPAIVAVVTEARAQVRKAPRSAAAWGHLGMVLIIHEFRPQGNFCLAEAERLDSHDPRWPYFQALGALVVTDAEGALPKLERTVALSGDTPDAPRVRLAEVLLSQNRLDEAEQQFGQLLLKNPRHPRAHLGLARITYLRGNPQASLEPLRLAQHDRRTRKAACQLLAEIQHQLGNWTEAEAARQQAAALPDDPFWPDPLNEEITALRTGKHAWLQQARNLSSEGSISEALALLQRTVEDYPEADDAWRQLGQTFLQQRNPPAAEQAFRRALELAPQAHENSYYLGATLVLRGDFPSATAYFRRATELKPDFAPAYHNLGNCLFHAADQTGALDAYRTAVRCDPNLFDAHFALATLLTYRGEYAQALGSGRAALALRPTDQRVRDLLRHIEQGLDLPLVLP